MIISVKFYPYDFFVVQVFVAGKETFVSWWETFFVFIFIQFVFMMIISMKFYLYKIFVSWISINICFVVKNKGSLLTSRDFFDKQNYNPT